MINREKLKEGFKNYLAIMCTMLVIMTMLLGINFIFVELGDSVQNINYGVAISNHVSKNNLTLPFPFKENAPVIARGVFDPYSTFYMDNFNKDVFEFHRVLENNYYYNNVYDCKYWAYVWTLYWKENREKYNWDIEYIDTENHVFVMVSNSTGYCVMDGKDLICMGIN